MLGVLTSVGLAEACINVMSQLQPAWNPHRLSVDIQSLHQPKRDWLPHVLQDMFMIKLSKHPHVQVTHAYNDGSINGSRSGCGLFIRDYISGNLYTDTKVSRCLPAHMSSTRAELYAVLEALHIVAPNHMNSCAYTYGRDTASHDRVAMRLRLGYKYFWEVSASPRVCCVLRAAPRGHTLRHCIMECPFIAKFRPQGQPDLCSLIDHLDSATLRDVLREYPQFARRL
ncbi:hypothetical protein E2C01_069192 [Portunus trituberculatus]|uniref:RNase H type-1 domain-containing protein n=1 Tax=Portunus trituberculatus TaxID=210409 RepID=A0A5B7HYK9_PORTR|nr:hypothetical protein [Portunus trituberculatus]